jgi:hypothetical protein
MLARISELEYAIRAGDTLALRRALLQRRASDGHVSEELDMTIGVAIRRMPAPLLRALRDETVPDEWLDGIVGNLGPAFADRIDAQRAELAARRESLLTVIDPSLMSIRDALVAELDVQLAR